MASYYSCAQGISAPAHARRELAALDGGECIGVGLGLLHGLAPFLCMCTLWCVETQFKARYSCASKLHTALDQLNNLLLVVAAMGVSPTRGHYAASSSAPDSAAALDRDALMLVISPLVLSLLLWMARFAEVAVASRRECARHETAQEILLSVPTVLLWTCALALAAAASERSDASHAPLADASIALLWTGNMWFYLTRGVRHLVTLWCVRAGLKFRPVERTLVCPNHGFVYHRYNEFTFIMLGETVLQTIIAAAPRSAARADEREHWYLSVRCAALGGFVLATCLMHSFRSVVLDALRGNHHTNAAVAKRAEEEAALINQIEQAPRRTRVSSFKHETEEAALVSQIGRATLKAAQAHSATNTSTHAAATSPAVEPPTKANGRRGSGSQTRRRERRNSLSLSLRRFSAPTLAAEAPDEDAERRATVGVINSRMDVAIDGEERAQLTLRTWGAFAALNLVLWQLKAACIMLVGVGVKLVVNDPLADATAPYATQQRLALAVPVATTFAIALFDRVYMNNRHHYSRDALRRFPAHFAVVSCRVILLICTTSAAVLPLRPVYSLAVQAGFACLQLVALHVQKFNYAISSEREHPFEAPLGRALDSLRLKALRRRVELEMADAEVQRLVAASEHPAEVTETQPTRRTRWMRSSKDRLSRSSCSLAAEQTSCDGQPAVDHGRVRD